MVSDLENRWVERARAMLSDREHIETRNSKNRYATRAGLEESTLCWPGYLGADFAEGQGVLVLANVHRDFRSAGLVDDPHEVVDRLVGATVSLRAGSVTATGYLEGARPAYERGLGPSGWTVASHINRVYDAAGMNDAHARARIAYANVSCGQFPERTPGVPYEISEVEARSIKSKMISCCNRSHPVSDLAELLRPSTIICMSAVGYRALERSGWTDRVATIYFHQWASRGLRLLRPVRLGGVDCEPGWMPDQWLPLLRDYVDRDSGPL